jgi:hypothetical protein
MGIFSLKKLFGNKNKFEEKEKIDLNKPVENPELKKAFAEFGLNKTEENLQLVIGRLIKANFIVLFNSDQLKTTTDIKGNLFFDKGSVINFLYCIDKDNKALLPVFTDWQEVDLWLKKRENNIDSFIMSTFEAFEWVAIDEDYVGIVINPGSTGWTMNKEQVKNFLMDFKSSEKQK